jgi:peptidoglycan/LPS O-acetylase OafA/YrhL
VEPATLISNVALVHLGNLVTMLVVSWTLFQEIVFYSFFGIAIAHRRVGFTLLGGWFALSCSMTFLHASPLLSNYVFAPINLLFGFGMVSMLIVRRFRVRAPELWFSAGLLLFGLCIAASVRFGPTQPIIVQLSGLGAAAALVGAMRLEELSKLTVSNTLAFLGDASYSIYLVHFPVMIVLARLLFSASRSHHVPLAFCAVALCFSGIVVGCAMHLFIERPLLRWMGGFRHPWLSNQRATQTAT